MAYSQSPINFGVGTGSSPLNDNGEKKAGVVKRDWSNPTGPHIDEQIKKYGGPKELAPGPRLTNSDKPEESAKTIGDKDLERRQNLAEANKG